MGERVLREVVEHVALVLGGVSAPEQGEAAVLKLYAARVVPCCHVVAAQLLAALLQQGELEVAVAVDAGVGRFPAEIRAAEGLDDAAVEVCRGVEHVVGKAQPAGDGAGVFDVVE